MAINVFISYSQRDFFLAEIIRELLLKHGLNVWIDKRSLLPGNTWKDELFRKARDGDAVILLMSKESSESSWVISEITLAVDAKIPIIPVALDKAFQNPAGTKFDIVKDLQTAALFEQSEILKYIDEVIITRAKEEGVIFAKKHGKIVSQIDPKSLSDLGSKLSYMIDLPLEINSQAISEGLSRRLMVGGCFELHHTQLGWGNDDLKIIKTEPKLIVREVLDIIERGDEKARDEGDVLPFREKYELVNLQGDFIDDRELRVYLSKRNWRDIVRAAENFEEIRIVYRNRSEPLRLFDISNSQIPNMLVAHIVVITSDNFLLLCQRTGRPYYYKWHWATSIEEQMAEEDSYNPFITVKRAISEELLGEDFHVDLSSIKFFSFFREFSKTHVIEKGRDVYVLNTGAVAIVNLPITLQEVWNRLDNSPDKEIENIVGLELSFKPLFDAFKSGIFSPNELKMSLKTQPSVDLKFAQDTKIYNQWHPSAKIRFVSVLRHMFMSELMNASKKE